MAAFKATGNADLDAFLEDIRREIEDLGRSPLTAARWVEVSKSSVPASSGGVRLHHRNDQPLIRDIAIFNGDFNVIPHPLGRRPEGLILVRQTGYAIVYNPNPPAQYDPTRFVCLVPDGDITVRALVF